MSNPDMIDILQQNADVYHSKRDRVPVTDDWDRPILDPNSGKPKMTWKTTPAERNFKEDLIARVVEDGLTEEEAGLVADRAIGIMHENFDDDRDGRINTVEVTDEMVGLIRDLQKLKS